MQFHLEKSKRYLDRGFSTIFGVNSENPENFGVVEFDKHKKISIIVEKPKIPKSNIIVSGLYFYTNDVIKKLQKVLNQVQEGKRRLLILITTICQEIN